MDGMGYLFHEKSPEKPYQLILLEWWVVEKTV